MNKLGSKGPLLVLGIAILVFLIGPTILSYVLQYGATKEFGASGLYQEEEVKALAEEVLAAAEAKDFEAIRNYIAEETRENVTVEDIQELYEVAGEDWGALKEVKALELYELKQMGEKFAVAKFTASFENEEVIVKVIFDPNMTLVDFSAQVPEQ